jgi:hypothetical protein
MLNKQYSGEFTSFFDSMFNRKGMWAIVHCEIWYTYWAMRETENSKIFYLCDLWLLNEAGVHILTMTVTFLFLKIFT